MKLDVSTVLQYTPESKGSRLQYQRGHELTRESECKQARSLSILCPCPLHRLTPEDATQNKDGFP